MKHSINKTLYHNKIELQTSEQIYALTKLIKFTCFCVHLLCIYDYYDMCFAYAKE